MSLFFQNGFHKQRMRNRSDLRGEVRRGVSLVILGKVMARLSANSVPVCLYEIQTSMILILTEVRKMKLDECVGRAGLRGMSLEKSKAKSENTEK